jgi:hypothetical protein
MKLGRLDFAVARGRDDDRATRIARPPKVVARGMLGMLQWDGSDVLQDHDADARHLGQR